MNLDAFYSYIKSELFNNKMTQPQVDGINDLLSEWDKHGDKDERKLAYILATVYHETGKRIQPVKEFGGEKYLKSKKYYPYYGRDLVQTTWKYNYEKVKEFSGIDVVTNPDLIGAMPLAAEVAIIFMLNGWYTGKKLSDYFNDKVEDPINARKIINGLDQAKLIAGYYKTFYTGLNKN